MHSAMHGRASSTYHGVWSLLSYVNVPVTALFVSFAGGSVIIFICFTKDLWWSRPQLKPWKFQCMECAGTASASQLVIQWDPGFCCLDIVTLQNG